MLTEKVFEEAVLLLPLVLLIADGGWPIGKKL
jgi:hypothetical protein